MPNYRRYWVPGGCYFFTVTLQDPNARLLVDHIDLLREAVGTVRQAYPFHVDAWVVLPNHMHAVWTLPEGDANFARRWKLIKLRFSKNLPETENRSRTQHDRGERGIWTRRFWEHTIRDQDDYMNHIAYIHYNPVKHGYVSRVQDWPHSTFHQYVAAGILPVNWCGDVGELQTVGE